MDRKDIISAFEFVVREVERLEKLRQTDWKQAAHEGGLYRLPLTYDDFPKNNDYRECGKAAASRLYEVAREKLRDMSELKGRIKIETFLKPIEIEFAQRALVKREKIDESMADKVIHQAKLKALSGCEDRTYFFPVYSINVEDRDEYSFGAAKFLRAQRFFADNDAEIMRSADADMAEALATGQVKDENSYRNHVSQLFATAKEHYSSCQWLAMVEIKGAEPDIGRTKAREILEYSFNLLRLAANSKDGQFIGSIEDSPVLSSVSHLSLKANKRFAMSHTASYIDYHATPGFMESYRQSDLTPKSWT
jgi:hypothetical protein